ncbi:hypothetical protein SAMCFNEI73_pC0243 (plasmid) [Sinorhizobium americanum]|uniref:Uncharacterized protein n=1 Tax=Sinorhizobium americanum TaxID=194963 RepID=A0A1L3LV50_9HYPH|nr:hypothetical protein SAMCFNEI73_pC0243 [Sinorhizobium americanum]
MGVRELAALAKVALPLSRYEAGEELKERTVDDTRVEQA